MAGPITVQGPDGQRYQFPEGTDPAVMKQAMAKRYPSTDAPAVSTPNPDAFPPQAGLDMADAAPVSPFTGAGATIDVRRERESAIKSVMRAASNQANVERMARVKPVEQRAARAGKAATAEAYSKLESPLDMALYGAFSPPYNMEGLAASNRVYDEAGVMPASEAASIRGMNSLAFGIPAMVNKNFREDVGQAGRDQPGAALAGDIAGYLVPGEAAWKATAGAYNKTLKPVINAFAPKGGGGLARGARLGQRYGEQAAAWAGQNALFQGTVGESTAAAEEGRDPSLASGLERAGSAAMDPINVLGPAALIGVNRALTYLRSGGVTSTPARIADEVSDLTGGRSNTPGQTAGQVLDMQLTDADLRPQSIERVVRTLNRAGMSREDVTRLFESVQQRMSSLPESQAGRLTLGQALLEALENPQLSQAAGSFPQAAFYLRNVLRGASQGGRLGDVPRQGDQRAGIVAGVRRELQGSQSDFVTDSAARNLGGDEITGVRNQLEAERTRLGGEYDRLFDQTAGAADPAALDEVQRAIDFFRSDSKLTTKLKEVALGQRMTVDDYIAQDPRRALHWMQVAAREIVDAERAAPSPSKITLNTYSSVRDQMLGPLNRSTPGYDTVRGQFGGVEEIDTALGSGRRFLSKTERPEDLQEFLDTLGGLSPEAQQGALASIRDEIATLVGRGGEEASARISTLTSTNALRTLESLGPGGQALADDLRFLKREQQFLGNAVYGSDTFRNMKASDSEALGNTALQNATSQQGSTASAMAGDLLVSTATQNPTAILTPLRIASAGLKNIFAPRVSTLNDEVRFLMARRGNIPELPGQGRADFTAPPAPPAPANAFASQAPQVSQEATTPARNPYFGRNAFRTNESGSVTGDVASGLAYGSLGGVSGNFVDYNQDGKQDWQDVLIGTGAGGLGAAGLNRAATTVSRAMPKGQTARLAETQTIPEAAAVIAEKFKPRKITRAATQDDWDEASEEAFNLLKAQAAKQDGSGPGARVRQEKAPDSLTDSSAPPRLVFEDLAEAILRSRGIDPDPVYGRMLAERPTNAETDVFRKTAGHYAGKARAKEREGMALDEMDDTDAAIEQMGRPGPKDPTMNGVGRGDLQNAFVGGTLGGIAPADSDEDRLRKAFIGAAGGGSARRVSAGVSRMMQPRGAGQSPLTLGAQNRILPVDRPDAFPGDDAAIARALDEWTPTADQQARPMGFGAGSKDRGWEVFNDPRLSPGQNKAVEMRTNGFSTEEIADEMDTSTSVVLKHLSEAKAKGVEFPKVRLGGPQTMTPHVLKLTEQGMRPYEIAERMGTTHKHISVLLSKERARMKKAGKPIPDWLQPRDPGGNLTRNAFAEPN